MLTIDGLIAELRDRRTDSKHGVGGDTPVMLVFSGEPFRVKSIYSSGSCELDNNEVVVWLSDMPASQVPSHEH